MTHVTIERAKLEQVLEALKLNNDQWKSLADSGDCGRWKAEDQDHYKQTNEAIAAVEQALAAPVQEPVAQWQLRHHLHTDGIWENCTESEAAVMQKQAHFEIRPLYTTPPAAPVPLTDEQIDEIVNRLDPLFLDVPESFTTDFARAIEAAHGITKGGAA
jgi:hypothetical protein